MNDTAVELDAVVNPIDKEAVRERYRLAEPFPFFCIDNFLRGEFAEQVLESFPNFEQARKLGHSFNAVNERGKVQVTDHKLFPEPVRRLNEALASREFLDIMQYITGIPDLLADAQLVGGGIHETGPRGHLDVHVDFNFIKGRGLHRRLNILIYFNRDWQEQWGGNIELWDADVQKCVQSFSPIFNRCVVFETSDISFHGVSAVTCPPDRSRKSFAAYYYTEQPPAVWSGNWHDTIFRARPDEKFKGRVLMPVEKASRLVTRAVSKIGKMIRRDGSANPGAVMPVENRPPGDANR